MSDTEPTDKTEGMMWMDTSTSPAIVWVWDGAAWVEFPFVGYDATSVVDRRLPELQYLVIGGGGSGGFWPAGQGASGNNPRWGHSGGGGAGAYRTNVPEDRSGGNTDPEVTPPEFTNIPAYSQFYVKVAGMSEPISVSSSSTTDHIEAYEKADGHPSSIEILNGPVVIEAMGGGGGGINWYKTDSAASDTWLSGRDGGSGGGSVGSSRSGVAIGKALAPISGCDSVKGNAPSGTSITGGSGGGGAGGKPTRQGGYNNQDGWDGGAGLVSSIDGLNKERAGGGAGAGRNLGVATGGGGAAFSTGSNDPDYSVCDAEEHTGGGGGGGSNTSSSTVGRTTTAPRGGSGLIVIRYLGPQVCFGGEVTTHNGYTVHTFKSDGIFTVGSLEP
jgi:hypothetical protein